MNRSFDRGIYDPNARPFADVFERAKRLQAFLSRITYKPGVKFTSDPRPDGMLHILLSAKVPNVHPPHNEETIWHSRMLHPLDYETPEAWLRVVRSMCHSFEQHEADEWLKLDGVAPFNPHGEPKT